MTSKTQTRPDLVAPDRAAENTGHLLQVTEVKPGLHENSEGIRSQTVYRISWHRESARLFRRWHIPGMGQGSGRFVKLRPDRIVMPDEAAQRYHQASDAPDTDATAVFLSTQFRNSHLELILASYSRGTWVELYRWTASWRELGLSRMDVSSF